MDMFTHLSLQMVFFIGILSIIIASLIGTIAWVFGANMGAIIFYWVVAFVLSIVGFGRQ